MNRVRLLHFNAALGPLDYRVPEGMDASPGTVVVAPLGPRQIVGIVWEKERLPADEVPEAKLRPLVGPLPVPPLKDLAAAADRVDRRLLLRPPASVARMVLSSGAALRGPATMIEYRLTEQVPERLTPAAPRRDRGARRRAGDDPRAGRDRGVSEGVLRGLVQPGRARTGRGRLRPAAIQRPIRSSMCPTLTAEQAAVAERFAEAVGEGRLRAVPARRGHRLGQDRSLFRGDRAGSQEGPAGACPASRNRADRGLPAALRGSLRLRRRWSGIRPRSNRPSAAAPGGRSPRRKRAGGGRRALGAVPALCATSA